MKDDDVLAIFRHLIRGQEKAVRGFLIMELLGHLEQDNAPKQALVMAKRSFHDYLELEDKQREEWLQDKRDQIYIRDRYREV